MKVELKHNKRTAEFTYRAKPELAPKVASMLRGLYGNKGYKVTSESVSEDTHIVAVTCTKWHAISKRMQADVPCYITGLIIGYDMGFLDSLLAENSAEFWDKPTPEMADIFVNIR